MLPSVLNADTTAATWPQRREELLELFRSQVFGRRPNLPYTVNAELLYRRDVLDGTAVREHYKVTIATERGAVEMQLALVLPCSEKPVPVVLLLSNHDKEAVQGTPPDFSLFDKLMEQAPQAWREEVQAMMAGMAQGGGGGPHLLDIETEDSDANYWPVADIIARGRAAAAFYASEAQPDDRAQFPTKLSALFSDPQSERAPDEWGTLGVWAFAASRMIDVLCEHPAIDKERIALGGFSRGGKTTLWCAAQDERISGVLVNNSGCTGAAVSRGKRGEVVASINAFFPHWFCPNYAQYGWKEDEMPFDQHMLVATVAPRLCYVTSGSEDSWSDPQAEWRGAKEGAVAWKLFDNAVCLDEQPGPGQAVQNWKIGYHQRKGGHDLTAWDWELFLDFLERHGK